MSSTCCPPDSYGFLKPDYSTIGSVVTSSQSFEYYVSYSKKESNFGVIILPDVFGWNGGRTRAIADHLAISGYHTIVPKLLVPPFQGGTDGEALPSDFFANHTFKEFAEYVASIPWEGVLRPRIVEAISILKSQGVTKIGGLGFCYGGYTLVQCLRDPATSEITFGANPHPSITNIFGITNPKENIKDILSSTRGPIALLPAQNDPADYRIGGVVYETLKAIHPDTATYDEFNMVAHGWVPRGDQSDPIVADAVQRAIAIVMQYFSSQFAK